jgi:hypothetical protein
MHIYMFRDVLGKLSEGPTTFIPFALDSSGASTFILVPPSQVPVSDVIPPNVEICPSSVLGAAFFPEATNRVRGGFFRFLVTRTTIQFK